MKPVKFYCEFCGQQVRANDKICSHCGSFFTKVRCPSCSFEGEPNLFSYGCPACGYVQPDQIGNDVPAKSGQRPGAQRITFDIDDVIPQPKKKKNRALSWIFWIVAGVVLLVSVWIAVGFRGGR